MSARCEKQAKRLRSAYLKDNTLGLEQQRLIGKAVSKQIGFELFETEDLEEYGKFCCFDWVNAERNVFGELKWRKIRKNAYKTTIVGEPKIKYAMANPDKHFFFVFRFVDGLYFCHFEDIDKTQKPKLQICKNDYREWVYHIPVSILKPLHELKITDNEDDDDDDEKNTENSREVAEPSLSHHEV